MEVVTVQIETLPDMLVLHSLTSHHFRADFLSLLLHLIFVGVKPLPQLLGIFLREQYLINNNIVRVDSKLGQLLHQTLRLVNG